MQVKWGEFINGEDWIKEHYEGLSYEERPGYALVSLKIKRFRILNRLYGRAVGDELSHRVYCAIEGWLRPGEYVGKVGTASFNLLLKIPAETSDEEILVHITTLNHLLRDLPDERFYGKVFFGYGIYPLPALAEPFYNAQYAADICRSECPERAFRNSHMDIYGRSYLDPNLMTIDYGGDALSALAAGHIKLYLQPKVDLKTGVVTHAEALMRWFDPEKGLIPIGDYLPMLEERGLISNVDLYLFGQVCGHIERWLRDDGKRIHISVNLSSNEFNYPMLLDDYRGVFEQFDCPKDCIEFELMESIILNKGDRVRKVVSELNAYGFTCSLDDFGSGFSSYAVLSEADLSMLKLDRSLFRDEADQRERILIGNIIRTAHDLDMQVVAEGVESPGYVNFLRDEGCDFIQGFVFYRPMPVEEFEARFVRGEERIVLDESTSASTQGHPSSLGVH